MAGDPADVGAPPRDRVRAPLGVLAVGFGVEILGAITNVVFIAMLLSSDEALRKQAERLTGVRTTLVVIGIVLVGASLVAVGRALRTGDRRTASARGLLFGAGAVNVSGLLLLGLWYVSPPSSLVMARAMSIADSLVSVSVMALAAFGLRAIGRARGRNLDGVVLAALVATGLLVGLVVLDLAGAKMGLGPLYAGVAAYTLARALLAIAALLARGRAPIPDVTLGDESAYRGPTAAATVASEGSLPLGFCAGFFGGILGLGLTLALAKGPATKRGAGIGFACQVVVGLVARLAMRT